MRGLTKLGFLMTAHWYENSKINMTLRKKMYTKEPSIIEWTMEVSIQYKINKAPTISSKKSDIHLL